MILKCCIKILNLRINLINVMVVVKFKIKKLYKKVEERSFKLIGSIILDHL